MKTLEKEVPIYYEDCLTGCMKTFVRISSFGQTVVTAIDPPDLECPKARSFLFDGTDEFCEDKLLKYKCRRFDPLKCELSGLLREESSSSGKDNCCNPPKLPCSPCRIGSGAQIKGKLNVPPTDIPRPGCGGMGEPQSTCCMQGSPCKAGPTGIQTSRGPKEPCGKAVVLKVYLNIHSYRVYAQSCVKGSLGIHLWKS